MSFLFMIMGPYLYRTWFYIIYAYQHRNDVEETTPIRHIEISSDMIQDKEFDKDRFRKKKWIYKPPRWEDGLNGIGYIGVSIGAYPNLFCFEMRLSPSLL